jgi:spore germination protein YaaH
MAVHRPTRVLSILASRLWRLPIWFATALVGLPARLALLLYVARVRVLALCLPALLVAFASSGTVGSHALPAAKRFHDPERSPGSISSWYSGPLSLPAATGAPAAAPPDIADGPPLQPHELFGFAPYWTLDKSSHFDVESLSTVSYFGVDVGPDGALVRSGDGWVGYQSEQLAELVTRAHAAHDHAVLTAKTFDPPTLHKLSTDPNAGARLSQELAGAIQAKSMDGANLDFEGHGAADRAGFASFACEVARGLKRVNPHWSITVDTYATSAADDQGWFDVRALADCLDGFMVMAYDMYQDGRASPNAPLNGYNSNDQEAVAAYVSRVPAQRVILGVPFYGYQWPTPDQQPNQTSSGGPTPMTYAQIAAAGYPKYWDPTGKVPWSAYQDGPQWHELYFDDPTSLALKAQLANDRKLAGLGIWALGMDGNDPGMMAALLGKVRPLKSELHGPTAPSPTPTPNVPPPPPAPGQPAAPGSAPAPGAHPGASMGSAPPGPAPGTPSGRPQTFCNASQHPARALRRPSSAPSTFSSSASRRRPSYPLSRSR